MGCTRNQYILSQWFLRNFCSDGTAQSPKEKQRVWAHVMVSTVEGRNGIRDIPLSISGVAVCKNCSRLTGGDTGEAFDIEYKLGGYKQDMTLLVWGLVQDHNFACLASCDADDLPIGKLANSVISQVLLNLNNPQSRLLGRSELFQSFINPVKNNLQHIISEAISLSDVMSKLAALGVYQRLIRIARSSSGNDEKAKTMFVLSLLLALRSKITMIDTMT